MSARNSQTAAEKVLETKQFAVLEQLGELTDRHTLLVHRMPGTRYLGRLEVLEFSLDEIKARWGGGRYKIQLQENGRYVPGSWSEVLIDGPPKSGAVAGAIGEDDPATSTRVRELEGQIAELRAGASSSPMDQAVQLAAVMSQNTAAIMGPLLAALTSDRKGDSASDILELAMKLSEFQGGLKQSDSSGGYESVLREIGLPLVDLIAKGQAKPDGGKPVLNPPQPDAQALAPPAELDPITVGREVAAWLKPHAERNSPPGLWAEVFADTTSPEVLEAVVSFLANSEAVAVWASIAPEVGANPGWYGSFIAELGDLLREPDKDDVLPDTAGGRGDLHGGSGDGEDSEGGSCDVGDQGESGGPPGPPEAAAGTPGVDP